MPLPRPFLRITFVLFFASGFCGLVYEVVWHRLMVLVFGNTTLATATILAGFMAGLSVGSAFWGRVSKRLEGRFLSVFGGLEIAIGAFALVFPKLLESAVPLEVSLSGSLGDGYLGVAAVRFLFSFGLLLIPTFLMGGALPILGGYVIGDPRELGPKTALLYGLNTAGAVVGAALTGFLLLREVGLQGSILVAALLNFAVGGVALAVDSRRVSSRRSVSPPPPPPASGPPSSERLPPTLTPLQAGLLLGGVGATGFCALGYQTLWTRLLLLVVDNSVYSFTIILVAFLLGIAGGSLVAAPLLRRINSPLRSFALVQMAIGVSAFLFPWSIQVSGIPGDLPYYLFLLRDPIIGMVIPCLLMGISMPMAVTAYRARSPRAGENLGRLFAVNALGSTAGAWIAGFVLIDLAGVFGGVSLLASLNWIVGGCLLSTMVARRLKPILAAGLGGVLLLAGIPSPEAFGKRLYGQLEPEGRLVFFKEGTAATSALFERPGGEKVLYLNGIPEVQTDLQSLRTFKMMGALPCILHGDPRRSLVITFGAGITAGTVARFSHRVDCVDLVREVVEISSFFEEETGRVLDRENVRLVINDARHHLMTTRQAYDVIVADATHPRGYDSWVLFTREFYQTVRSRLAPNGVFCQWLPFHGMNTEQYMTIVKTFQQAFPHTSLWTVDGTYSLLAGTARPPAVDVPRLEAALLREPVRSDLARVGLDDPYRFLAAFSMGPQGVARLTGGVSTVNTDDSPGNLFFSLMTTPVDQYRLWPLRSAQAVLRHEEPLSPYVSRWGDGQRQQPGELRKITELRRRKWLHGWGASPRP